MVGEGEVRFPGWFGDDREDLHVEFCGLLQLLRGATLSRRELYGFFEIGLVSQPKSLSP